MTRTTWRRSTAVALALGLAVVGCARNETTTTPSGGSGGSTPAGTTAGGGEAAAPFINPEADCTSYNGTMGVSGDTIKIGTIRPTSGPYAIYDQVTAGVDAYFKAVNAKGGIKAGDGKTYKIELIKEDDGYDPARTPGVTKKLVESDQVFGLVGVIGTESNLSVRQYLNDGCVPNIGLATGSTEWGKANQYPWYISALASYATEAHGWIEYLKKAKPDAKIALLYQDDDFGKGYQGALKKGIEGTNLTIVDEASFSPLGGGTTEAAVTKLSQSNADVFIVGIGGTPCPASLKSIPTTWKPITIISITCAGKTALSLAGGADEGVITAQVTYDPSDPTDKSNATVTQFVTDATAGWGFAAMFDKVIQLSPKVDRATVMNTAFALKDARFGLVREGVTVNTNGAEDPWAIEGFRMVQRKSGAWVEVAPIANWEGQSNSFAG